jgi:hypothetical protein
MPWPDDELAESVQRGLLGDGASARRAAELYELIEDFGAAQTWWRRAAGLGDQDAISYVEHILRG